LDLEWLLSWITSNWLTVFGVLATIAGLFLGYLAIRKPRWRKYRCRALPYARIFRGEEYGYNPRTFLKDVRTVDFALGKLETWYKGDSKPLLLKGVTGAGKSRLATEFIGRLGVRGRIWRRVLMPTPYEMSDKFPPIFTNRCILFLNDLHEFRGAVPDSKLSFYIENKKLKVVATIPTEKYDPNWEVLSRFTWHEVSLEAWASEEGRRLAEMSSVMFDLRTFRGTPLSVLAPNAELRRSYEVLSSGEKAVLRALKLIKIHLGCYADYELISTIQSPEDNFNRSDFLNVVSRGGFWCKTYDSRYLLADGLEECIPYDVSVQDAYRLQAVLAKEDSA
jgi:hypothetical protein